MPVELDSSVGANVEIVHRVERSLQLRTVDRAFDPAIEPGAAAGGAAFPSKIAWMLAPYSSVPIMRPVSSKTRSLDSMSASQLVHY
jgi:hypothetical protein